MKKKYSHIKVEEREMLAIRHAAGVKDQAIAGEIGKHVSAIYRELKRNKSLKGLYLPIEADKQAKERKSKAHQRTRIPDEFTRKYIEDRIIQDQWTPEQISGRLKWESP